MGISVKQALELDCLKEGKVLSGDRGLSNIITCVNIMEEMCIRDRHVC